MDRAWRRESRRGAQVHASGRPISRTSNEKHIVTPGRIVPARELLGDMLLQLKQPDAALKEYEASQLREPNRFRNYLGSAQLGGNGRATRRRPPPTTRSCWRLRRMPTPRDPSSRARRSSLRGEEAPSGSFSACLLCAAVAAFAPVAAA
jgi:hypothetical protein